VAATPVPSKKQPLARSEPNKYSGTVQHCYGITTFLLYYLLLCYLLLCYLLLYCGTYSTSSRSSLKALRLQTESSAADPDKHF